MIRDTVLLQMPDAEPNGFVKTLNNMGFMTSTLDPYSLAFTEFAPSGPGPAVDIGAAYGVATLVALEKGAVVIANDLDSRHLDILFQRTPVEYRRRLMLKSGAFPDGLDFREGTLGSILISRVLHFFDGPQIENAAEKLFRWMSPGGKVFIVAETPFLKNFQTFLPIYEHRRKAGEPWPGWVENVSVHAPERGASLPPQMHLLDPAVLSRVFTAAGFVIERASTFARPEFPLDIQLDGRESVGLIARRPGSPI